jgi:hypothetical protein
MNKIRILVSLGVVATLVLALMPATSALADAPIRWTWPADPSHNIDNNGCSFDIWEAYDGVSDATMFVDQNGNFKGISFKADYTVTWSANGKTHKLEVKGPYMIKTWKNGNEIDMSVGTNHKLVLPGYGPVFGYAGQISVKYNPTTGEVIKEKAVGNIVDPPNWDAICAYFAP